MKNERAGYYQVTTREDVKRDHCGEIGDIVWRTSFGVRPFCTIRLLSAGRLEVEVEADEERRQEIGAGIVPGRLTSDGNEVFLVSHAYLLREDAEAHARQLIEAEIARLRKKLETFG